MAATEDGDDSDSAAAANDDDDDFAIADKDAARTVSSSKKGTHAASASHCDIVTRIKWDGDASVACHVHDVQGSCGTLFFDSSSSQIRRWLVRMENKFGSP